MSTPANPGSSIATFVRIAADVVDRWQLTDVEASALLGASVEQLMAWRSGNMGDVTRENLVRFDHILGLASALEVLLGEGAAADEWVHKPNKHPIFNGAAALNFMLGGGIERIELVHRYLAGEAWGVSW